MPDRYGTDPESWGNPWWFNLIMIVAVIVMVGAVIEAVIIKFI